MSMIPTRANKRAWGTSDCAEATTLLHARNESVRQPQLNLQMAKAFLAARIRATFSLPRATGRQTESAARLFVRSANQINPPKR